MAPTRSARIRLILVLFHSLLCFVIVMQILGVTTSYWTLGFDSDLITASLSEGLSLTPSPVTLLPVMHAQHYREPVVRLPSILFEDIPFRPPYEPSSARS
jgi:hypothetical protein